MARCNGRAVLAALAAAALVALLARDAEAMKDAFARGARTPAPRGRAWRSLREDEKAGYGFADFVEEFARSFRDESEAAMRKGVFEANLALIHALNARAGRTWTAGVNNMTDWTQAELDALKGRTWTRASARHANEQTPLSAAPNASDYPLYVDWRLAGKVSPVKNQMACGSCFIFSAVSAIESHVAIETDALPMVLSTQEVVDCLPNLDKCGGTGGCGGGTQELVYSYAMLRGLSTNATFPYYGENRACEITTPMSRDDGFKATKAAAGITGYMKLKPNNEAELLGAVANLGPVSVSVDASKWYERRRKPPSNPVSALRRESHSPRAPARHLYESGVFDGCDMDKNVDIDHAVVVDGYGIDGATGSSFWLVRNSWGFGFGEDGYIRVLRSSAMGKAMCGFDETPMDGSGCASEGDAPVRVCGMCGILSDSSVPQGGFAV